MSEPTNDELRQMSEPTNDELRQMREAYANDDIGSVDYISFLEAHAADQQRRIDELTAALKPFAGIWRAWLDERGKPVPGFSNVAIFMRHRVTSDPYENHLRNAYEALRGKGGGVMDGMMNPSIETKTCPECGRDMIEGVYGMMLMTYPPSGSLYWICQHCDHVEYSRPWRPTLDESDEPVAE